MITIINKGRDALLEKGGIRKELIVLFLAVGFFTFITLVELPRQASGEEVPTINVELDGEVLLFPDTAAYLDNQSGRVLVPMRFIFEKLGAAVS